MYKAEGTEKLEMGALKEYLIPTTKCRSTTATVPSGILRGSFHTIHTMHTKCRAVVTMAAEVSPWEHAAHTLAVCTFSVLVFFYIAYNMLDVLQIESLRPTEKKSEDTTKIFSSCSLNPDFASQKSFNLFHLLWPRRQTSYLIPLIHRSCRKIITELICLFVGVLGENIEADRAQSYNVPEGDSCEVQSRRHEEQSRTWPDPNSRVMSFVAL